MGDERKPIGKDASGYDVLTIAVKALLNQFPGLYENETVKFEELGEDSGIAFSADNGALIFSGWSAPDLPVSLLYYIPHILHKRAAEDEHTGIS